MRLIYHSPFFDFYAFYKNCMPYRNTLGISFHAKWHADAIISQSSKRIPKIIVSPFSVMQYQECCSLIRIMTMGRMEPKNLAVVTSSLCRSSKLWISGQFLSVTRNQIKIYFHFNDPLHYHFLVTLPKIENCRLNNCANQCLVSSCELSK